MWLTVFGIRSSGIGHVRWSSTEAGLELELELEVTGWLHVSHVLRTVSVICDELVLSGVMAFTVN